MPQRRRNGTGRGRSALLWALFGFALIQGSLSLYLETACPSMREPDSAWKIDLLHRQLAHNPHRPRIIVLGSSRAAMGFRPDLLTGHTPAPDEAPVLFNYALKGAGPLMELVCLQRLFAEGIEPDWIILEVLPPMLNQHPGCPDETWVTPSQLGWTDLHVMTRYADRPHGLLLEWLAARLVPAYERRLFLMYRFAVNWLTWEAQTPFVRMRPDEFGWLSAERDVAQPEDYRRWLHVAWEQYCQRLQDFRITRKPRAALREILEQCRRRNIGVVLLTMPEGQTFQSWYAPEAKAEIAAFLTALSRDYAVPWVDARSWVADDGFWDNHHLLPRGAALFTERFGREVLAPLAARGYRPATPSPWLTAEGSRSRR